MKNNDIAQLLYRIKENIQAVETGTINDLILQEIQSDYLKLLELIKLFLISERDSYYGYFLMNMQFQVDFHSRSIAGIKLNEFPPVLLSNPLLLCKFSLKEIIFVICHEIDHVVLNHPAEMLKENPEGREELFYEFNLAADASVNDRINQEIEQENHSFMSPPKGVITSDVLQNMFRLKYVEPLEHYKYYLDLIENRSRRGRASSPNLQNGQESVMRNQGSESGGEGGTSQQGTQGQSANGTTEADDQEDNGIVTAANYGGKLEDHDWQAGADSDDAAAAVRELVNASVGMMNDESRGMMPGAFLSQVRKINEPPKLSWQAILKKYVGTITASKRKTRMRLNRRQPERFDLSGAVDEKVLKIVVAIDTSASVDDRMIAQIFNEIFSILAKRKHDITVIECDTKVQRVYKAKNRADIQMKVKGRGGTSFSPVIQYINKDRYFRDALLIYFTDGYGENAIPRPRTYRNLWVVIGDEKALSVNEPYGTVLSL